MVYGNICAFYSVGYMAGNVFRKKENLMGVICYPSVYLPAYSLRPDVDNLFGIVIYDVVIEGYALTAWAVTRNFLTLTLMAILPLTNGQTKEPTLSHREWQFSFGIGVPLTIAVVLTNPNVSEHLSEITTWLYVFSQLIENSLLGWIVFAMLSSANQITHYISNAKNTNIFDATPFRPVAHWCLSVAVAIMGAITIATLFLQDNIFDSVNLITYTIAGVLGVFVFFAGMWSTHQHMLKNKEREINRINTELLSLHSEIMLKVNQRELDASRVLIEASNALTNHRVQVEKAAEWPYTVGSIGGLATSISVPVIVNILGKIF